MYIKVTKRILIDAFEDYNLGNQFSEEGFHFLFKYLNDYEGKLDVIDICTEFREDNYIDVADYYGIDLSTCKSEYDRIKTVVEYLNENTTVLGYTDSGKITYQDY